MLITVCTAALYLGHPGLRRYLENKAYDLLLKPAPVVATARTPVIVDLDEKSLARHGQWPWPRYLIARLLAKIKAAGAAAVGIDILFAETDRTSLKVIQRALSREFQTPLPLDGIPARITDNDEILADRLSRGAFILGFKFQFDGQAAALPGCRLHPLNLAVAHGTGSAGEPLLLLAAQSVACPLPRLAAQAAGSGFINATPDSDGVLRRLPLIIRYQDQFFPSLALAAFCKAQGITQALLSTQAGRIDYLQAGTFRIPLDAQGNLLVRYPPPGRGFKYISAADLLSGSVKDEVFRGRTVFLGTSAAGLEDHRVTPVAAVFHGVEVHATVVDNIQSGNLLNCPHWMPALVLALTVATGLVTTLLLSLQRALISALMLGGWGLCLWFGAVWSLNAAGVYIAPVFPLLVLAVSFSGLTFLKFVHEERRVRRRTQELAMAQEFTLQSLAALAETRDQETGGHIQRVQRYVRTLCEHLKRDPKYRQFLDEGTIDLLYKSAPLHDIGKVGVPDRILRKRGKLTDDEYAEMKKHTIYGLKAIERAEAHFDSGSVSRFLRFAKDFTYTHHERWDGKGYPRGVAGEQIPVAGRLMSLADVYDALVSRRVYKPAFSHGKAVEVITQGSGTLFDPEIVSAFRRVEHQFQRIAEELADRSARHPEDYDQLVPQRADDSSPDRAE